MEITNPSEWGIFSVIHGFSLKIYKPFITSFAAHLAFFLVLEAEFCQCYLCPILNLSQTWSSFWIQQWLLMKFCTNAHRSNYRWDWCYGVGDGTATMLERCVISMIIVTPQALTYLTNLNMFLYVYMYIHCLNLVQFVCKQCAVETHQLLHSYIPLRKHNIEPELLGALRSRWWCHSEPLVGLRF